MRVNWEELRNLDQELHRQGWENDNDITLDVYFVKGDEKKSSKATLTVQVGNWLENIYKIIGQPSIRQIVAKDPRARVFWQVKRQPPVSEKIPTSGHDYVVESFDVLEPLQRQVWTKITESALVDYMSSNESTKDD